MANSKHKEDGFVPESDVFRGERLGTLGSGWQVLCARVKEYRALCSRKWLAVNYPFVFSWLPLILSLTCCFWDLVFFRFCAPPSWLIPTEQGEGTISAKHWRGVSNWRPVLVWLQKGAALLKWRVFCWIHRFCFIFFSLFHHSLWSLFHHSHWSLLHCYSISFSLLVQFSEKQSFFCSKFKF